MVAVGGGDQAVDRSASAATSGSAANRNSLTWSPSLGSGLAEEGGAVDPTRVMLSRSTGRRCRARERRTAAARRPASARHRPTGRPPTGRGAKWSSSTRTPDRCHARLQPAATVATVTRSAKANTHGGPAPAPSVADRGGGVALGHGVPEGHRQTRRQRHGQALCRTASTRQTAGPLRRLPIMRSFPSWGVETW